MRPGQSPIALEEPAVTTTSDPPAADDLIIKEARRRHRQRVLRVSIIVVVGLALLGFGLVTTLGNSPDRSPPVPRSATPTKWSIRSFTFSGSFVPEQVVSTDGSIWILGSNGPETPEACSIEEIDPVTLQQHLYAISVCGYYLAVGNGLIYLAGDVPNINSDVFHLEIFNPVTKHTTVMNPVIITTQGSGRAHMDMTYGAGSIWVTYWGSELVQVSPSTGAVIQTITNAPSSEGGHGTIVANSGGIWIAEGASSPAAIYRLAPGSRTLARIYTGTAHGSVLWLSSIGSTVWADVATGSDGDPVISTRLIAFDLSGRPILEGPKEPFGDVPLVGTKDGLWSIGSGARCTAPQELWRVDPATGSSTAVTTLLTPIEPCLTEDPTTSQIAVAGQSVFVLEPTGSAKPAGVIYRVQAQTKVAARTPG